MPEAQGFFDPMMPGGLNLAAGARDIVGTIVEKQRYEDEQRVQEEKLRQAQEGIDIDRLRTEAYAKHVEGQQGASIPDWMQKGMFLSQIDPERWPSPGHAVVDILKIKDPEKIPVQVDPALENEVLLPQYGSNWRQELEPSRFWAIQKEHTLSTRPSKENIQTEAEYREEIMKYDIGMDKVKLNGLDAIAEKQNADIMVQFGDENQKGMAAQRYQQQAAQFIEMWNAQRERGHQSINQAYLKGSTSGKTSDSSGTALGGAEPKPPAGWAKTGTTPDGKTIYLTPEGKRMIWGKE
jgi:hypothetical protein